MRQREKEKLCRDWEYMEREVKKLAGDRTYCFEVGRWFNASTTLGYCCSAYIEGPGLMMIADRPTVRQAIKALRRAVEGKDV